MELIHAQISTESDAPHESQRRSAGYLPTVWEPELIMSFTSAYKYENHATHLERLKQATKDLLESTKSTPHRNLTLIDEIHRLGVAHHFDKEIKDALETINSSIDLFSVALQFRLLRQNGFLASSEVFNMFLDKDGEFMDSLKNDALGLLSLYEASYLGLHGEIILEKAKDFSTKHLKSSLSLEKLEKTDLSEQIQLSLQTPLRQMFSRMEARNFINFYQKDESRSLVLLELAKLDYNLVQSNYLEELKELAKWWKDLNFKERYHFGRDRLVENHLYSLGCVIQPQFSKCRRDITKFCALVTILDDIYDIYGSLDELEKLTEAFIRWELKAMDDVPEYLRPMFLAIYEHVKETVDDYSSDFGMDILSYLKEVWVTYTKGYMNEARWMYGGYMPTFDEYIYNATHSIGVQINITYAYFSTLDRSTISEHLLECIVKPDSEYKNLPSLIVRLYDDLKSSKAEMERGEVMNSITCYMAQKGVSEEEARGRIKSLLSETWTKLNDLILRESLPTSVAEIALNPARIVRQMYAKGDWYTEECQTQNELILSSIFVPLRI